MIPIFLCVLTRKLKEVSQEFEFFSLIDHQFEDDMLSYGRSWVSKAWRKFPLNLERDLGSLSNTILDGTTCYLTISFTYSWVDFSRGILRLIRTKWVDFVSRSIIIYMASCLNKSLAVQIKKKLHCNAISLLFRNVQWMQHPGRLLMFHFCLLTNKDGSYILSCCWR